MGDFKFEVWPTEFHKITQHFGANPRNYAQFGLPGHDGIDIRAPTGSRVFCVAPGEVFRVHNSPTGHNYGIHVRVLHEDGYKTIYGHMQEVYVREGQIVKAGTVLGLADNTGNSFGSHLHLTLKKDGVKYGNWPYNIIDPTPFLLPLLGWTKPAGPYTEGWLLTDTVFIQDELAQVNPDGATLYINREVTRFVPAGTIVIVTGAQEPFTRVRVARASIGLDDDQAPKPSPEPPATVATVDGWAWKQFLTVVGKQAIVGVHGLNLRTAPDNGADNIGLVKANSTVSLLGAAQGSYLPIRVRRNDFTEPVSLPIPPPDPGVLPPKTGHLGWALTQYLSPLGQRQALTSRFGVNLRNKPDRSGHIIGLVKAYATVSIAGLARDVYTPVLVSQGDLLNVADPMPGITLPDPLPAGDPGKPPEAPHVDTTPGWVYTNGIIVSGSKAKTARFGSNLRDAPRRDGQKIGYVPPDTAVIVTGSPKGEYTPVRVKTDLLEPPTDDKDDPDPDSNNLGTARIGLHASADPEISEAEHREFADLRPGIIKILSFHSPEDIGQLAKAHPDAAWIVRAFLHFGGRRITPDQFLQYTLSDVKRSLGQLSGRYVVVELHNEPNITDEGLGTSWADGAAFDLWWRELLKKYRLALPGVRFIYPGLSPGATVLGVKQDHVQFLEASRLAVEAADGVGVHLYWSAVSPMEQALATLDDYISRLRSRSIWITEAGHFYNNVPAIKRAQEYLQFWGELQSRPVVKGVAYWVASASDPKFAQEVWVGKGIGKLVGRR